MCGESKKVQVANVLKEERLNLLAFYETNLRDNEFVWNEIHRVQSDMNWGGLGKSLAGLLCVKCYKKIIAFVCVCVGVYLTI